MNRSVSIGERLREERQRLGLSQPAFAEIGGVTKKTQVLYESGERQPDTLYMASIGEVGVDVLYVITGKRDASSPALSITLEERRLLDRYAAADETGRKMAHRVLGPDPDQVPVTRVARRGRKTA